jgi:hypothetical protein
MKRVGIVLGVLGACGKSAPSAPALDEVVKTHGGAAEPIVAAAEKIAKTSLPAVAAMNAVKMEGPGIKLGNWGHGDEPPTDLTNTTLVYAKGLGDLTTSAFDEISINVSQLEPIITNCASLVRKKKMADGGASKATKYLKACAQLKYMVVLRQRSGSKPKEDAGTKTFTPGSYSGDVFVFDLGSGKMLGGFTVDVTSGSTKVKKGESAGSFQSEVEKAVLDGLKKYAAAT